MIPSELRRRWFIQVCRGNNFGVKRIKTNKDWLKVFKKQPNLGFLLLLMFFFFFYSFNISPILCRCTFLSLFLIIFFERFYFLFCQ